MLPPLLIVMSSVVKEVIAAGPGTVVVVVGAIVVVIGAAVVVVVDVVVVEVEVEVVVVGTTVVVVVLVAIGATVVADVGVLGVAVVVGATDEVGCFDLHDGGITGVADPTGLFTTRHAEPVPGTCVTVTLEGRRPLLAEIQALVSQGRENDFGNSRRVTSGLDSARTAMTLAVLELRAAIRVTCASSPPDDVQLVADFELAPDTRYTLVPEGGLRQTHPGDRSSLSGAQWQALQASIAQDAPFTATLRACAEVMAELKPQLRALLNYHCGVGTLRTRQMMIDIQSL